MVNQSWDACDECWESVRCAIDVMAGVTGLEPATSGVTGRRSNRLSYTPLAAASGAAAR
jgi:hypothetical protein